MRTNVHAVRSDATLATVVEGLADAHITSVPVVDRHHHLVGVVSTTDVLGAQAEQLEGGEAWEGVAVILNALRASSNPSLKIAS